MVSENLAGILGEATMSCLKAGGEAKITATTLAIAPTEASLPGDPPVQLAVSF